MAQFTLKSAMSSTPFLVAASASAVILLSACSATPKVGAQWTDPGLGGQSGLMRNAKVLVACEAADVAIRQVCQEQLAAEVVARGATPVLSRAETPLTTDRSIDGQLVPIAREAGARAVLVVTLTPASVDASPGFSIGIGGFGIGRSSGVGVGVAAPIGGGRVETGFAANGRVTDVSNGRLVWTASAAAPPSSDLNAQFSALSKAVLDAAEKSGLF